MKRTSQCRIQALYLLLTLFAFLPALHAENQVMGEIQFQGQTKVEKSSGVWVDGHYVGYLDELKGNKKVLLLPGEHTISVRQNGYQDFNQTVMVKPGEKQIVHVAMIKAPTGVFPATWATLKIAVNPPRAAVFLDGRFVGHVSEFAGLGRSLQVAPGEHAIKIALPGYKTFETNIDASARQKVEIRTNLLQSDLPVNDPSLENDSRQHPAPPPPDPQR
jgi:PEGA domain